LYNPEARELLNGSFASKAVTTLACHTRRSIACGDGIQEVAWFVFGWIESVAISLTA
jgi:hypothetical protein